MAATANSLRPHSCFGPDEFGLNTSRMVDSFTGWNKLVSVRSSFIEPKNAYSTKWWISQTVLLAHHQFTAHQHIHTIRLVPAITSKACEIQWWSGRTQLYTSTAEAITVNARCTQKVMSMCSSMCWRKVPVLLLLSLLLSTSLSEQKLDDALEHKTTMAIYAIHFTFYYFR